MIASLVIRPLRPADIPALVGVLSRAYASQQKFELRLHSYLDARDVATFVADLGGEPVGMVVGNDYGPVAYVSQMAVDPVLHRKGIGTALMDALTAWADAHGFAAVELDATPPGAPLYARYGFVECGQTLVYAAAMRGGDARHRGVRAYVPGDFDALCAADAAAFGADRSDVLRLLLGAEHNAVFVTGPDARIDGYAVAQRRSEILGPVIAPDADAAVRLIDAARALLPAGHRISVSTANPAARTIVAARGYRFARPLAHMIRGTRSPGVAAALFARINLGQG